MICAKLLCFFARSPFGAQFDVFHDVGIGAHAAISSLEHLKKLASCSNKRKNKNDKFPTLIRVRTAQDPF